MTASEFQIAVSEVGTFRPEEELDDLCLNWIRGALESNGPEGGVGLALLELIKERCMP